MASDTTTFPLTGPIKLQVRLGYGSITVTAQDDPREATVRLSPRHRDSDVLDRITVRMEGPTLLVTGPHQGGLADLIGMWRRNGDGIDAVIHVPAGTPVRIASASDAITVTGQCGDADIASSAAHIDVETVAGDLRLRYGNGDSHIAAVTGSAHVAAGRGNVSFGEVGAALECRFGSGELNAVVTHGDVHARAGKAVAELGAVYGDVDLAFGAGAMNIGLPAGVAAHVDATSGTGQVHTDLPVEPAPAPGRHTISVRARTGAGDIRLQRAAAAA